MCSHATTDLGIAEWFRLFCVVAEGPKGYLFSGAFLRRLTGSLDPQNCLNFWLWKVLVNIHNTTKWIVWWTRAQNTSFRTRVRLLGGLNHVPLNFGNQTPKTVIFGLWIGLSSVKEKNSTTYNINANKPIMTKFVQLRWVVPQLPLTNPIARRTAAILNFVTYAYLRTAWRHLHKICYKDAT